MHGVLFSRIEREPPEGPCLFRAIAEAQGLGELSFGQPVLRLQDVAANLKEHGQCFPVGQALEKAAPPQFGFAQGLREFRVKGVAVRQHPMAGSLPAVGRYCAHFLEVQMSVPAFIRKSILLLLVIGAGAFCGVLIPIRDKTKTPAISPETWTLARVLSLSPAELEKTDIAVLNLACAEGFSDFDGPTFSRDLETLDQWSTHVKSEIERNRYRFDQHPEEFHNSWAYFQALLMVCVLQEDCGIHYDPDQMFVYEYSEAKDSLLHGLLGPERFGTCANMPVLYVAVGRRLGFPLFVVTNIAHVFVRWESPDGKTRFNIEGRIEILRLYPIP